MLANLCHRPSLEPLEERATPATLVAAPLGTDALVSQVMQGVLTPNPTPSNGTPSQTTQSADGSSTTNNTAVPPAQTTQGNQGVQGAGVTPTASSSANAGPFTGTSFATPPTPTFTTGSVAGDPNAKLRDIPGSMPVSAGDGLNRDVGQVDSSSERGQPAGLLLVGKPKEQLVIAEGRGGSNEAANLPLGDNAEAGPASVADDEAAPAEKVKPAEKTAPAQETPKAEDEGVPQGEATPAPTPGAEVDPTTDEVVAAVFQQSEAPAGWAAPVTEEGSWATGLALTGLALAAVPSLHPRKEDENVDARPLARI